MTVTSSNASIGASLYRLTVIRKLFLQSLWFTIAILICVLTIACSVAKPITQTTPAPPAQPLTHGNQTSRTSTASSVSPSSTVSATFSTSSNTNSTGPTPITFIGIARPSTGATLKTLTWNFGDGVSCSTCGVAVTHLYQPGPNVTVSFTVTDSTGAIATATGMLSPPPIATPSNSILPQGTPFTFTSNAGMSGTVNGIVTTTALFTLFTGQLVSGNPTTAAEFAPCGNLCTSEFTVPSRHFYGTWNGNVTWQGSGSTYQISGNVNPGNHPVTITVNNVVFSANGSWSN